MIDSHWLGTSGTTLVMVALSGVGVYIALLLFARLAGLRSFSKMSSFDFATTVAVGSIVASTLLSQRPTLAAGVTGLAVLFTVQYLVAKSRRLTAIFERLVDNEPVVLMAGARVIANNLDKTRITEDDLRSKLRMAGVTHPRQVFAVILETTGDVSVLKADSPVDPWLFEHVRDAELLDNPP